MKRFVKKTMAGALALAMVVGTVAVADTETAEAKKVTIKKVAVTAPSGKTAYVAKGKKVKLSTKVTATPNKSANKKVTYKSANAKIASVNSKGQIKGVKAGSTKITVASTKNTKKKATIKVVVKKAAVNKVTMDAKSATVAVGDTQKLAAKVTPSKNVCKILQWTTSNKKVATVTAKGVVKGVSEGTATITAKAVDGSGKKATCKVTVGAGIVNVSVPISKVVRVELSNAKTFTAANFVVQNKRTPDGKYTTKEGIEKVETKDGGKTYDIVLDEMSRIESETYVKVTIDALKGTKSKEVFVGSLYGDVCDETTTTQRVSGMQNETYETTWELDNVVRPTGMIKYSVSGVPEGLKVYISKSGTRVKVKGKFKNVENGTKAVLTGVDETGKEFKKNYVFYVGSEIVITGNILDQTVLSYIPKNTTTKEEASGYSFGHKITASSWGVITGGSGSYKYSATGLPMNVSMDETGDMFIEKDADGNKLPVAAGTYAVSVTVTDTLNPAISAVLPFTLNVVEGVTLTGTVRDAAGATVKKISVVGESKIDVYGRETSFDVETKEDGTYKVRVIPGEYSEYIYFDTAYDNSIGNVYTEGTVTKDFTLPLYCVTFTTGIEGATAYDFDGYPQVFDEYGVRTYIYQDSDKSLYTYLKAGTYEFSPAANDDDDVVSAYEKYQQIETGEERVGYHRHLGDYVLSGSFTVVGNGPVGVTAKMVAAAQ